MVLATVNFQTSDADGFAAAIATTGHLFEDVPGFGGFELRRGVEDRRRYLLTAHWGTVDDHLAWQKLHADEFLGVLGPYLAGPPDIAHFA